jgi:hypothetical protein
MMSEVLYRGKEVDHMYVINICVMVLSCPRDWGTRHVNITAIMQQFI